MGLHQVEVTYARALVLLVLLRLVCCASFRFGNGMPNAPHLAAKGARGHVCLVAPSREGTHAVMESHANGVPAGGDDIAVSTRHLSSFFILDITVAVGDIPA